MALLVTGVATAYIRQVIKASHLSHDRGRWRAVYTEQRVLAANVRRLHEYLLTRFPYPFRITIADNASTDATWEQAQQLAAQLPQVSAIHLDQKGRGRALRTVWAGSDAEVVSYM